MNKSSLYNCGFLVVAWLLALVAQAQIQEQHTVNQSFLVNPKASIEISNKYGTIHLTSWDKDSVKIQIDYELTAKNEEKLWKMKDNLDFEFKNTDYYVTAKTVFNSQKSRFNAEIQDMVQPFAGTNQVTINYKVFFPRKSSIKVYNKFGDIYCDDVEGDVRIKLSHGDLKAASFGGDAQVDVRFGNGHVTKAKNGRFTIEYSEFTLNEAEQISIKSKSSKFTIGSLNELKTNSRRDKFYIKNLRGLIGESTFSEYQVEDLSGHVNMTTTYGELTLGEVETEFSSILINSKYTDLFFTFKEGTSYRLGLSHKKVDLQYPLSLAQLQTMASPTDNKVSNTTGTIGSNGSPASRMEITAESCDVVLIHK